MLVWRKKIKRAYENTPLRPVGRLTGTGSKAGLALLVCGTYGEDCAQDLINLHSVHRPMQVTIKLENSNFVNNAVKRKNIVT